MNCENTNKHCQSQTQSTNNSFGYIIIIVLYILLAIILGAALY